MEPAQAPEPPEEPPGLQPVEAPGEEKQAPAERRPPKLHAVPPNGEAAPTPINLTAEMAECLEIARDPAQRREDRLEAFEDILDSEVGDSDLLRARNIERSTGLRQVYLKFEGGNPTGTQKDRIAFAHAVDALRQGYDCMTVATCGNYGAAVALAAYLSGLQCEIVIPERYHSKRIHEMEARGARIHWVPGTYEDAVRISRERADSAGLYDANPGGANEAIQLWAYAEIAYEIYDVLRDAPKAIAVPVSNGTTLAGIYRGFYRLYRRGRTSRMPMFVAGSARQMNPIVDASQKGLERCQDLRPEEIRETEVNEPLVNWHSIDGDHALYAIRETGGWAEQASDRKMQDVTRMLRRYQGLNVLPASTAGLIALLARHEDAPLPSDRYVAVVTGKG
jgi:threonine synthase